jgi:hypothetical protein
VIRWVGPAERAGGATPGVSGRVRRVASWEIASGTPGSVRLRPPAVDEEPVWRALIAF